MKALLCRYWPLLGLAAAIKLFMWRVVLLGEAFVPAQYLRFSAPWSHGSPVDSLLPWNPLLYDSVGQFYPWRHFASESLRSGTLPLWNPFAFCGTPFVANSQSAVFYPGNILYWVLPTSTAAGWSVVLHLLLAAAFMWLLVRRLTGSNAGGFVAGIAFALSGWQCAWLHLPTFLCTSCWIPLAVYLTLRLRERPTAPGAAALAACVGTMLVAGHLQIAFYGLLAVLVTVAVGAGGRTSGRTDADAHRGVRGGSWVLLGSVACALLAAGLLASVQLLPTFELSRRSHRTGPPTQAGYEAYAAYAVGPAQLAELLVPSFHGEPANPALPYRGLSKGGAYFNHAEGAIYVGVTSLMLAGLAFRRRRSAVTGTWLFAALGAVGVLIAFATPIDALFYFYVPGFGQSGSPGRALVLWAFSLSGLAGVGVASLLQGEMRVPMVVAALGIATALLAGAWLVGAAAPVLQGLEDNGPYLRDLPRQLALIGLTALVCVAFAAGRRTRPIAALPALLVVVDLLASGANLNPTAPAAAIYPDTSLIEVVRAAAGHDRVMPVNTGWSFAGPKAVLPPNGALVFGLRDVQGYDSLFPGQYKEWMNRLAARDSSPPEVGNMVFARDPLSPMAPRLGVRVVLSRTPIEGLDGATAEAIDGAFVYAVGGWPGRVHLDGGAAPPVVDWRLDSGNLVEFSATLTSPGVLVLADQRYPGWHAWVDGRAQPIAAVDTIFRGVPVGAGRHTIRYAYRPDSFAVGLYLALVSLAVIVAVASHGLARPTRSRGAAASA